MLAQLTNVSLSFPDKKVLEEVSLTVYPGDRIALVGANGAGKTSLFRMLAGRLETDAGTASRAEGVRIGHLEQGPAGPGAESGLTCMEAALAPFGAQIRLERRIEGLATELGGCDAPGLLEELGENDLLVLDEPTNHLDRETQDVLATGPCGSG
jgi:ATPase subunit of ABC transporter with duplicated ATPase domains